MPEYKDNLRDAILDEVSDFLAAAKLDNTPPELLAVKRTTAIQNITDGVMGKLRLNLPQFIEAAAYEYNSQIIWAKAHLKALS